jgi:hypothetical protein
MIEILEYPEGQKTPYLLFDGNKGILKIEGKCIPEYAQLFFQNLHPLIDKYAENPQEILDVTVNLSYFNSSTARELMIIFKKFLKFPTKISWLYEKKDEDMIDAGEDFQDILKIIPFTFKVIER